MSVEQIPSFIESFKISCAIEGLLELRKAVDKELEVLKASEPELALVSGDYVHSRGVTPIFPSGARPKKKPLSQEVKNKISKAQKTRWSEIRKTQGSDNENPQVVGLAALLSNEHHI